MPPIQTGLRTSATGSLHPNKSMESRIRHFHATPDADFDRHPPIG